MIIKHIVSTNLAVIMYEPKKQYLYAVFKEGSMYRYKNITEKEFLKLFENDEKTVGELFYSNIRGVKPFKKIY